MTNDTIKTCEGLWHLMPLHALRRTPGVSFDYFKLAELGDICAIDRVIHTFGAISPGPVGDVERPWYMHTHQVDNLLVMHGTRYVDLYTPEHGRVERFTVKPDLVLHEDRVLFEGACVFGWPTGVFHRVVSCENEGSASLNLAIHQSGFNIRSNFSIYRLDVNTGESTVIREGHLDQ